MPVKNTSGTDINTMKNKGISPSVYKGDNERQKNTLAKRYGIIMMMISRELPKCGRSKIKGNKPKKKTANTL